MPVPSAAPSGPHNSQVLMMLSTELGVPHQAPGAGMWMTSV